MESNQEESVHMLKKIENYIFNLKEKIGEGSFSRVYKGTNIHNQSTVAVKKVRVSDVKSKIARRLLECEVNILKEVKHPNIIQCLDIHFSINNCYIITEFCEGGNLYQLIRKTGTPSEHTVQKIILSIFQALNYLASLGIVHRDIKLSNILITNGQYKIGDFGFAIKTKSSFRDVSIGSPMYMSPEGLIQNLYGPKTDVWAFGILIYELLHGSTPLQNCKSEEQLRRRVLQPPPIKKDISPDLQQLMLGCLRSSQSQRMSIADIANSNYIKRARYEAQRQKILQKAFSQTDFSTCSFSSTSSVSAFKKFSLRAKSKEDQGDRGPCQKGKGDILKE